MKYHGKVRAAHKSAIMFAPEEGAANILREDVCLPAAVIKQSALENNLAWMQRYADASGVSLAPHGKTTMAPALFKRQMAHGAWGIGVGTAYQAQVAAESGVPRIIIANQLLGKANMALVSQLKARHQMTIFCCVDSADNARELSDFFAARGQQMDVLLELGVAGGRCGCRTRGQAETLARQIAALPGLRLAGVELYEGVVHGDDARQQIEAFLLGAADFSIWLGQQGLLAEGETLLTGAGSAWFDVVCQSWRRASLPATVRIVIRPGCYIAHDRGVYQQAQEAILARDALACELGGNLSPALELVALVQSVPESGRAIVNIGKRDAAFDAGLPQAIAHYRHGERLTMRVSQLQTVGIMDQHAMLTFSSPLDLRVGDVLVFATSHPCLTFDKWRELYLVDDEYGILETMETYF